jgi:phosphoribosyl 1,2-cyclic phosphate phosphodiesterase
MALKVTFLGTGTSQGVPPIGCESVVCLSDNPKDKRLRASVLVQWDGKDIIIDTGPDFRYQMLREKLNNVDAILFTHEHRDHTAGLDDIRPINYIQNKRVPVYLTQQVLASLKDQFAYIFEPVPYPGIPELDFHIIENKPFQLNKKSIIPIQVMHYKLPVLGFRLGNFAYITDANFIADEELKKLIGVEVLVLNALRKTEHISHFTLQQATDLALKIGAKQTYFTHMSHQIGLHDEVCAELPTGIDLAFDGLSFEVSE